MAWHGMVWMGVEARRGLLSGFFGAVQAENDARRLAHLWQCPTCQYQVRSSSNPLPNLIHLFA
jgi:cytochrome c-type biogenesis protein CcmH/NrfF